MMGKIPFCIIVATNASISSLVIIIIIGTYFLNAEEVEFIWLLWLLSQPLIILLSIASLILYRKYLASENDKSRTALYVSIILAVTLLAPVLTFAVLSLIKNITLIRPPDVKGNNSP